MEVNMEGKQTSLIQRMLEAADLVVKAVKLKEIMSFFSFLKHSYRAHFSPLFFSNWEINNEKDKECTNNTETKL